MKRLLALIALMLGLSTLVTPAQACIADGRADSAISAEQGAGASLAVAAVRIAQIADGDLRQTRMATDIPETMRQFGGVAVPTVRFADRAHE